MKLMRHFLLFFFAFTFLNGFAQEKVIFNDEHVVLRDVQDFSAVVVGGPFKVYYSSDNDMQVAVSAKDSDARDRIITKVSGGTLYISLDQSGVKWWGMNKEFKVYITAPKLNSITVSGAVNFVVVDVLKSSNLSMKLSGASDFSGKVECNQLKANLTGASDCKLSGLSNNLEVVCTGASSFKGVSFKVDHADVVATGASNVKLHVTESFKAKASGASNIQYKGSPKVYNQSSTGASSIKQVN